MDARTRRLADRWVNRTAAAVAGLPLPQCREPTFVVGTGRSGTTAFGTALAQHPQITYLNEPRELWYSVFPESDIWSRRAAERHGRLEMTAEDADARRSARLRRRLFLAGARRRRPVLVEKLPANAFRIPFLLAVFPDARFIHLTRQPVEVAASIRGRGASWWGVDGYKWRQLQSVAAARPADRRLPEPADHYERGLLEWRLSNEAVQRDLTGVPASRQLRIRYDALVDDPSAVLAGALGFLCVQPAPEVDAYVREHISRRSAPAADRALTQTEQAFVSDVAW